MMKTLCLMDSVSRANGGIFEADFDRHIKKALEGGKPQP